MNIKSFKISKRKGNITILSLFMIFFLFVLMGCFLLDGGFAIAVKSDLYNVANAAAMAGTELGFDENRFMYHRETKLNKDAATKAILDIIKANQREGKADGRRWPLICNPNTDIVFDNTKAMVKVTVHTEIPTSFLKLVGVNSIKMSADATSAVKRKRI